MNNNDKTLTLFGIDELVSLDRQVREEINPDALLRDVTYSEGRRKIFKKGDNRGFAFASMVTGFEVEFCEEGYDVSLTYQLKEGTSLESLALGSSINECFTLERINKTRINYTEEG
jgi:hypothetical protein